VSADDRELQRRLEALEAEVKADSAAKQQRKEEALAKLRAQQAQKQAEKDALAARQAAMVKKSSRRRDEEHEHDDGLNLETAVTLAKGAKLANQAKRELSRPRQKGEKSWLASGGLSFLFGPLGWLYAGSFRESIPAGILYVIAMTILSKLPMFLVWPVIMIALPLSAIAGVVYALQYNRHGKRQRLFDRDDDKKKLASGDDD
jgi:hypothetical protein